VSAVVVMIVVGLRGRPERQTGVAVRSVLVMFVCPKAVPMHERAIHDDKATRRTLATDRL
jgi:hypothetical protein